MAALTLEGTSTRLSRHGGLLLYEQLKQAITGMIEAGLLRSGEQIPTTAELCQRFGVSHITVTRALNDLVHQGIITRIQGKGTFVTTRRVERQLGSLVSFTREMGRQGLAVRSQILDITEVRPSPQQNLRFHRPAESSDGYVRIRRLRFLDGIPACLATSIFPDVVGRRLLRRPLEDVSFYDLLENHLGLRLLREERWITPTVATRAVARVLVVRRGAPLFKLEGMTYLEGDIPIEATDSLFRGDRFRFVANMYRFIGDGERDGGEAPPGS